MELATYLEESRTTYEAFAEQIGVSIFAVGKYARRQRTPRPEIMARIKRATDGAVTADDFLPAAAPTAEAAEGSAA